MQEGKKNKTKTKKNRYFTTITIFFSKLKFTKLNFNFYLVSVQEISGTPTNIVGDPCTKALLADTFSTCILHLCIIILTSMSYWKFSFYSVSLLNLVTV